MSLSKQLFTSYQEQLNGSYVKQNLAEEFVTNLKFERNHPLYENWKEWKDVVSKYYSKESGIFQKVLFDQSSSILPFLYDNTSYGKPIFDAGCFSFATHHWKGYKGNQIRTVLSEILYSGRKFYPGDFDMRESQFVNTCKCVQNYWNLEHNEYPFSDCKFQREHILNIFISLIVHLGKRQPRAMRKYYRKLARVFYVLPTRFLLDIDLNASNGVGDLLFSPKKIFTPGRNLLKQIYERGVLDKIFIQQFNNLPYWFEENKHFRNNPYQQGSGTNQSVSATMFDSIADLVSKFPKEQGFGNLYLKHELKISDEQFTKFEEAVERTHFNFMSTLKNTLFDSAKEIMVMFVLVATVAMLGYTVIKYGLDTIITTLNLLYQVTIGKISDADFRITQQAGGLSIPFLPAMVVNSIISPPANVLSTVWNHPQTDRVMRRIGYLGDPKVNRGVDMITEWLNQVIRSTINWYKEEILGLAPQEDIDSVCSPIVKWYQDCDEFFQKYYDGSMLWNDINWSILMNLYGRGMALVRQNVYADYKNDVWKIVFKLGNVLEKFNAHGRTGATIRNPPVTIYLAGGTGVGKSSITYPMAAEILQGIFQREECCVDLVKHWKNLIYMRCPEQEFWDGYENQLVTIFDDFGQLVDSTSSPNLELFEVIRAANSFPYPLHMASLDQKATTTFNSKIIMASSNLERPKTESLNFAQALHRRFDLCVRVTQKPGTKKIPGKFDPNIYEFQLYNMDNMQQGQFVTYKDIIYMATVKYFERKGFVDSMDDYITSTLRENRPVQQGFGTLAGNAVCGAKTLIKSGINTVYNNYVDFKTAINDDPMGRVVQEVRPALRDLHAKLDKINDAWNRFKEEHKYMYKALKLVGIFGLVFGVLKLFSAMTTSGKKEKLMSIEQFTKSEYNSPKIQNPKVEKYGHPLAKNAKVESYVPPKVSNPKVEFNSVCEHESEMGNTDEYQLIDNRRCELCCGKDSTFRIFGPRQEGYVPPQIKNPKVEGGLLPTMVCAHRFPELWKKNPFKIYFLKKSDPKCDECNPKEEGVRDVNAAEILAKVIRSNFYKIYTVDTHEPIGHAMFLRGQVVMCPRHYTSAFERIRHGGGSGRVYFQNVFLDRAFEISVSEILERAYYHESPDERDQVVLSRDIMAFPVSTATFHGNIVPYFAEKNNLSFVRSSDVLMPVLLNNNIAKSERACVAFRFSKGHSSLAVKESTTIDNEEGRPVRIIRNLWEYSMDTQAAECGAPIIVRNVNIAPGKIIGMHVAGHDSGLGYATPVYKQDVEDIISKFNKHDTIEFRLKRQYGDYPTEQCQVPKTAEFIRIGSIPRPVAQPTKSKIVPSPLFNKITETQTRPCALGPVRIDGEIFDPRTYRLSKLGNIPDFIRQLEVDFAVEALVDEISQNIKDVDFGANIKSVYTFEEAVVGIDGEEFINAIKRTTSPGYPYVHLKGFESRKNIFGDDEKCDMDRPQCKILKRQVEEIIEGCRQGVVSEHIFMDTLKDERKPLHKWFKTRLFSAGPLDYLIACKMYFNGIVAVLQKARNKSGISVGTNVYSQDWSDIARKVLCKSSNIVAGDFEGFDSSQIQRLLMAAGSVLIRLSQRFCGTSQEEAYIMYCLLISLFNSVHVTGREIYQWTHSLPSGHYLTAIINSIFVLISFCVIWQIYKKKTNYITARSFYKKCGIVAYGDDHVLSVPSDEAEFNQFTIPNLFKLIGLNYTMEDKDAVVQEPFRKLEDVSYLKRKFVFNKSFMQWLSPLDLKTVLESPMWLHKCPDPIDQVKAQIDNSLRELSLHDEETWNKWIKVFAKYGQQLGHYTEFVNHAETRALVLE
uniref:Non-structural protein n=1 Tax=Electric ant dicistrovirus TaxID=3003604 RepID=A0AA95E6I2_9VIRU|nr:non-structural protein [Electric ant dicistrovirus]